MTFSMEYYIMEYCINQIYTKNMKNLNQKCKKSGNTVFRFYVAILHNKLVKLGYLK